MFSWDPALCALLMLKAFSLYFVIIALFTLLPLRKHPVSPAATHFCCIIAARNEERVIGALVKSLKSQNYPQQLCDIYVIPNNCTDDTEKAARDAGAAILHCTYPVKSKGDALRFALGKLIRNESYDAFLVFDADNTVNPDFLARMNDAFLNGYDAVKSRIVAANPYDSWVSGCYGLYFETFNTFFNRSRAAIGLSAKLIGTGMGFSRRALLSMGGWNTVTMAEDTEFYAECALNSIKVAWVPDAVVFDEEPLSFRTSFLQRKRWISGIMEVSRVEFPKLIAAAFSRRPDHDPGKVLRGDSLSFCDDKKLSVRSQSTAEPAVKQKSNVFQLFDTMMILATPYMQAVSAILTLVLPMTVIADGLTRSEITGWAVSVGIYCAAASAFALFLALKGGYRRPRILASVLMFPVFTFSWTVIAGYSIFFRTRTWTEIAHTGGLRTNP